MKEMEVSAKVPANVEKGIKEASCTVFVKYADTLDEAKEMFGEETILTNAFSNWKVTLQGNIRSALRKGESPDSISARLADAKMGVVSQGIKVDPVQAYLAKFQSATPEEQAKMLAELKQRAAA